MKGTSRVYLRDEFYHCLYRLFNWCFWISTVHVVEINVANTQSL
jgi:hypothetical protein